MTDSNTYSRRQLLHGAATAGAGAVTLRAVDDTALDPTGEADAAIATGSAIVIGAAGVFVGAAATAALTGGGGSTKDGETAAEQTAKEALQVEMYGDIEDREEINRNSILSTDSLLQGLGTFDTEQGLARLAFEEAQVKADEAIKAGKTQSEVQSAAKNEAMKKVATAQKQILEYWKISLNELGSFVSTINTEGYTMGDFITGYLIQTDTYEQTFVDVIDAQTTVTLADGSTLDLPGYNTDNGNTQNYGIPSGSGGTTTREMTIGTTMSSLSEDQIRYLNVQEWTAVWDKTKSLESNLNSEIDAWVNTLYEQSQAGNLDLQEYVPPSVWRTRAVEESDTPKAIADLLALNVPVDLDREMTISYTKDGIDWTASGWFAATQNPSNGYEVGTSYTPQTDPVGNVYMTVHYSDLTGDVPASEYQAGIDGGILTLTSEPRENLVYELTTNKTVQQDGEQVPETARISADQFSKNGSGNWEADLSLENSIAEVQELTVSVPEPDTDDKYLQIVLKNQFTVEKIKDSDSGTPYQSATVEAPETSDPTNWRDNEDFKAAQERRAEFYDKMLERFEKVENDQQPIFGGGSLFGGSGGGPLSNMLKILVLGLLGPFLGILVILKMIDGSDSGPDINLSRD